MAGVARRVRRGHARGPGVRGVEGLVRSGGWGGAGGGASLGQEVVCRGYVGVVVFVTLLSYGANSGELVLDRPIMYGTEGYVQVY